ncbi:MAG: hypothetical protein DMG05_06215 [Acidobacteria bacterium]|nr:MAG: hypothetical protein DMG05_06215 [Acidobacteriota bacterium]
MIELRMFHKLMVEVYRINGIMPRANWIWPIFQPGFVAIKTRPTVIDLLNMQVRVVDTLF